MSFASNIVFSNQDSDRIGRALDRRIYLMDASKHTNEQKRSHYRFEIQGTTDVYEVLLRPMQRLLTCSCPDFEKRHRPCKHIYFICFRVLPFTVSALSRTSWEDLDREADKRIEKRQEEAKIGQSTELKKKGTRKPFVGENCAVCYELMTQDDEPNLMTCWTGCGQSIHGDCWKQWLKRNKTCVHCRKEQPTGGKNKRKFDKDDEEWLPEEEGKQRRARAGNTDDYTEAELAFLTS
jgi:hypothetical protein